jgi:hypothetical protein
LDPTGLYLLGRATTAVFGTLTVFLIWIFGRIAYGPQVGLLSALFLAVCFSHVRDSHYAVNDVALSFFLTLVMLSSIKIVQDAEKRWYVLAGVALGLGFATKYSAAAGIIPILVAHFLSPSVQLKRFASLQIHRLIIVFAVAVLAAVVVSPYFVITPGKVISDAYEALYLAGQSGFDGWQIDPAGGYIFYLKSMVWGIGWGLLFLALGGVTVAAWRHSPKDIVLLSLPIVMYLMIGRQKMYFARFILPIVPVLMVLAAAFLQIVITRFVTSRKNVLLSLMAGAILVTLQPLVNVVRHNYLLEKLDTRTLAMQWIEANIPSGAKIAVDWPMHGPPLSTSEKKMPYSNNLYQVSIMGGAGLSDHSITWYREQGFDYLVTSSSIYNIPLLYEKKDNERRAFYASLDKELELVQDFRPYPGDVEPSFIFDEIYGPAISLWQRERPGPTIKIYRIP